MASKKDLIQQLFKRIERDDTVITQAREKARARQVPPPKTDGQILWWLIDEWAIHSDNADKTFKQGACATEGKLSYHLERAAKMARFVSDLLSWGVKPEYPWLKRRKR